MGDEDFKKPKEKVGNLVVEGKTKRPVFAHSETLCHLGRTPVFQCDNESSEEAGTVCVGFLKRYGRLIYPRTSV